MSIYLTLIQKVLREGRHSVACSSEKQAYRIKRRFYEERKALLATDPDLAAAARNIMVSISKETFPNIEFCLKDVDDNLLEKSLASDSPQKSNDQLGLLSEFLSSVKELPPS